MSIQTVHQKFSTDGYNLTENEAAFMLSFLSNNGCGAQTPDYLLSDNFSCQTFEDLIELFPEYSQAQIKGFLGSLVNKQVIWVEDDRGYENPHTYIRGRKNPKLPDLYWVCDGYLEELDPELKFW